MKTVQKLELMSGIFFLSVAFFGVLFSVLTFKGDEETIWAIVYVIYFLQIFVSFILFVGSYLHVVKGDNIGFGIIIFFGSTFLCFYGYSAFFALLVGPPTQFLNLIIYLVLPGFFVSCTVIFGIINFLASRNKNQFS